MPEENSEGGSREIPTSNTLLSNNINLSDSNPPMALMPEKVEGPPIPHFRETSAAADRWIQYLLQENE